MTPRAGRTARVAIATVVSALLASACTTSSDPSIAPYSAPGVTAAKVTASQSAAPTATPPTATPPPTVTPPLLAEGSTGDQVRDLQARLKQLKHFTSTVDGTFDPETTTAVKAFQDAHKLPMSGSVDQATWDTLAATTKAPSAEDLAGHLIPGPAVLASGSTGAKVRELQARLKQLGRWTGDVTSTYGPQTVTAVKGYQTKRGLPVTGEVDQRTMDRIWSQTRKPTSDELNNVKPVPGAGLTTAGLDPRCLVGRVICASKTTRKVVWVVDGVPILSLDARFGRTSLPTSEGSFRIYLKSRDHWSQKYDASMPFALFFNGGQAVHYSPEFASIGYSGVGSHGCINTRDKAKMAWLFDQARIGDLVVVYR
ncbi:MAG: peptidoglycan-binding protein [Actinomycetales bacterium]|nr:peptidoglycan-binding protein [Candidatus Phosphoribacter baldrii]